MSRFLLFFSLILLLFSSSGCQQFREFFSRDSEEQEERAPRRRSSRRRNDEDSSDRDPIRDMFKIRNKPAYMYDKYLTPHERALLQEQLHGNDPAAYKKSFRSTYKEEQKKRQDWVFGR
ncbi:MAG: hypothetical protein IKC05_09815 [Lentisphaeria bacterium]|nr:hypothetical protein [Lentisphaeria bacterium]